MYYLSNEMNSLLKDMEFCFPSISLSSRGRWVNDEDYDIIPKKHLIERQIKEKEEKLKQLKDRRKNDERWYDEQEKALEADIGNLRTRLAP